MKKPLIIDRPDLQTWRQRAVFGALTAVFWVAWFFLWLPAVTLAAWVFFGARFQLHMIELEGYKGFASLLGIYALVIVAMGGSLLLWAKYNHWRFRGVDRRREFPRITLAEVGRFHGRSEAEVARWRTLQVMTVHHDEHGAVMRVDGEAGGR